MQLIEERHRRTKAESQEKYSHKLAEIKKKFSMSYEKCLLKREEKEKKTQEKTFKKYQAYYFISSVRSCYHFLFVIYFNPV